MKIKIYCPKCSYEPKTTDKWVCHCGCIWNTFDTAAKCPACDFQWLSTQCPGCSEWSKHSDWYHVENDKDDDSKSIKSMALKEVKKIKTYGAIVQNNIIAGLEKILLNFRLIRRALKMRKHLILLLMLFTVTVASGQSKIVVAYNVDQMLSAIASNITIQLSSDGNYNLSKAAVNSGNHYTLYDGALEISNVSNFSIIGLGSSRIRIFTGNKLVPVIHFDSCNTVSIKNVELGHNPKGKHDCGTSAYVLYFTESFDIAIENCMLWGCGTHGIVCENVDQMWVTNTDINDCSDEIMNLFNCSEIEFHDCIMHNNGRPENIENYFLSSSSLINIYNCIDVTFSDCSIYKNQSVTNSGSGSKSILFAVDQSINILLDSCSIYDNCTDYFSSSSTLQLSSTSFKDNIFSISNFADNK
jgi:hypothetical protein